MVTQDKINIEIYKILKGHEGIGKTYLTLIKNLDQRVEYLQEQVLQLKDEIRDETSS